jgi:glycosyltransferase involved in cell wall biosynthesis
LRILVLTHEYPPVGGGGGRVAKDLSQGFVQAGNQVHVITAHCGDLPLEEEDRGVKVRRIKSMRKEPYQASFIAMLAYVFSASFETLKLIHNWKPDVLHVHFAVPAGPIAWLANRLTNIPYILTIHLGDVPGGTPQKTDRWFKFIFPFTPPIWKRAAKVVAVSSYTKELALKRYDVPIDIIHNGIPIDPQHHDVQLQDPIEIVFAGRMIDQKDPVQVVRILAQCKQYQWHCTMFGDGPLKDLVEYEIKNEDLESRFNLPGWQSPEMVQNHLLQSDILLIPSLSEGMPVIGVQALAAGLCLMVSKVGGFVEIVDEGENGYLLQAGGGEIWSKTIKDLLQDKDKILRMKQKSLEKALQFDLNVIVNSYLSLFQNIVQENDPEHPLLTR